MLNKALELAQKIHRDQEYRVAAIITDRRGKLISLGVNSFKKSHPRQAYYANKVGKQHKIYLHAELDAIIKLNSKKQKAHTIYIARTDKQGNPCCSKPCEICQMAIKDVGIKRILYT